jgi:hypothetical protein
MNTLCYDAWSIICLYTTPKEAYWLLRLDIGVKFPLVQASLDSAVSAFISSKIPSSVSSIFGEFVGGKPQLIVAGGAVFQAIHGEEYVLADVDLFCTPAYAPHLRKKLHDAGIQKHRQNPRPKPCASPNGYFDQYGIKSVEMWDGLLQIIVVDLDDVRDAITRFDMSIVRNYYDGHTCHVQDIVETMYKITHLHPDAVALINSAPRGNVMQRINKNPDRVCPRYNKLYTRMETAAYNRLRRRIAEYTSRGVCFEIN